MASGSATRIYHSTLVASTVDTVTLALNYRNAVVVNRGSTEIYATTNGAVPTVGGAECWVIPANASGVIPSGIGPDEPAQGVQSQLVVKLISSGTPPYSVVGS